MFFASAVEILRSQFSILSSSANYGGVQCQGTRHKMVEAGGVEPPSEKRCATKPTCLSQFNRDSLARTAVSPVTLRTSKKRNRLVRWFSPAPSGPKGLGQLTV